MRMGMAEELVKETAQKEGENGQGAMANDEDEVQRYAKCKDSQMRGGFGRDPPSPLLGVYLTP